MKFTRLQKAKDYRIFRDFAWPASALLDFGRFNVIYGCNGAGKTSLSNIFRYIQRKAPLTEGQVEIHVDQTRVSRGGLRHNGATNCSDVQPRHCGSEHL